MSDFLQFVFPFAPESREKELAREILAKLKMDFVSDEQRKAIFASIANQGGNAKGFSKPVKFYRGINDATYDIYGWKRPTKEEEQKFVSSINELDPYIKDLWKGDNTDIVLASAPNEHRFYGMHQSNWIVLGDESFDGSIAQHEFIHHIISQGYITEKLPLYDDSPMFTHAQQAKDGKNKNEDLTCMLSFYDSNDDVWANNIIGAGEGVRDKETAFKKINSVKDFLGNAQKEKGFKNKEAKDIYDFLEAEKRAFDNWVVINKDNS